MVYFDATFFLRLYVEEPGFADVREVAVEQDSIRASILAKMETGAALHRQLREGKINSTTFDLAHRQFLIDQEDGIIEWYPLSASIIEEVNSIFRNLPSHIYLRTGDAIHLVTAVEAGLKEIYSNDRHLLAAATLFKLKGINPLAK